MRWRETSWKPQLGKPAKLTQQPFPLLLCHKESIIVLGEDSVSTSSAPGDASGLFNTMLAIIASFAS